MGQPASANQSPPQQQTTGDPTLVMAQALLRRIHDERQKVYRIVNELLPIGYTPPRGAVSNEHTKKVKARKRRQLVRLRESNAEMLGALKKAHQVLEYTSRNHPEITGTLALYEARLAAEAAIAKAEAKS